jgi:hypothetical protein
MSKRKTVSVLQEEFEKDCVDMLRLISWSDEELAEIERDLPPNKVRAIMVQGWIRDNLNLDPPFATIQEILDHPMPDAHEHGMSRMFAQAHTLASILMDQKKR